jgi:leucyl-tRNA synthetase
VQVNGKLRGQVKVTKDAEQKAIERIALENEQVVKHINGQAIRKVIVVPGRLVNIVV